jgi:molybdopterin/thiamine biosynthesis adenylyltransferase
MSEIFDRQYALDLNKIGSVLVMGVGGIGSWVALDLALSGCARNLILADFDIIEESNLNRTPFRLCDIGKLKVDALKYLINERRASINVLHTISSKNNVLEIQSFDCNVIIDCRDIISDDLYNISTCCKHYYKVGYDGFSITIDPKPEKTKLMELGLGQLGYRAIPSYIIPAQLAACLVINEILTRPHIDQFVTFDCRHILPAMNQYSNKGENNGVK